jgi:hypothetical protein
MTEEAKNELPMDTKVALNVVFSKDIHADDMPEHIMSVLTACLVYLKGVNNADLVDVLANTLKRIDDDIVAQHEEAIKSGGLQ